MQYPESTYDHEFEQVVLGAMLIDKVAFWKVCDILEAKIFHNSIHQLIYLSISELAGREAPITILSVKKEMGEDNTDYLMTLTSKVSSADEIEYNANILRGYWVRRRMIDLGDSIQKAAVSTKDAMEIIPWVEGQLVGMVPNIGTAIDFYDLIQPTLDKVHENEKLAAEGKSIGIPSGLRDLDELTAGWQSPDLIIVAARPAMGKTSFGLDVARASAKSGVPAAFFSLEMSAAQLGIRIVSAESGANSYAMRTGRMYEVDYSGQKSSPNWDKLNNHSWDDWKKHKMYVDDTADLSLMDLRAKGTRLKVEKNIGLIVIDYLQLMSGDSGSKMSREQEVAKISRGIKVLGKKLKIPIIALSQLSRAVETRGGDKKPTLSDLRESGAIEQDADMVMFLYRPAYYGLKEYEDGTSTQGITELIIAKQRSGPVDTVKVKFNAATTSFEDLEPEFQEISSSHHEPPGGHMF